MAYTTPTELAAARKIVGQVNEVIDYYYGAIDEMVQAGVPEFYAYATMGPLQLPPAYFKAVNVLLMAES